MTVPPDLDLIPVSRWPTTLPADSVRTALALGLSGCPPDSAPPAAPTVSIVIATRDNRVFLTLCLRSVLGHSGPDCEVIVVDNGSTDGTVEDLRAVASRDPRVRLILNDGNRGFAGATNQGAAVASGSRLVLLNDDTIVPPGWLPPLIRRLDDPAIGVVGPVSNRAGNEAQIETGYRTYDEMVSFAAEHARAHEGAHFDIRTATMFCAAMRLGVWQRVGPLDEQFEIAMFEDDDFAMRTRAAGHRVICVEDAFVHHFGQASVGKLAACGAYGPLFHANRQRWEVKWQRAWQPYRQRQTASYEYMVERLRLLVDQHVPADATVLVASRGDAGLLQLGRRSARHFPQTDEGEYAGHHPADGSAAVSALDRLTSSASAYFIVPAVCGWWLERYPELVSYLDAHFDVLGREDSAGTVWGPRG